MADTDTKSKRTPKKAWRYLILLGLLPLWLLGSLLSSKEDSQTISAAEVVADALDEDEPQLFYEYTLLGETEKAGPFDITRMVPPDWDYRWRGPELAQVHWSDGKAGKLTEMWGVKGGRVWFTGTAGDVVLIRIIPPGSD